ncbi:unnamed protein product [Owenia fusiformis]|uniref:Uncharacterized protein n=1 Tax=Owenia fusiformis TaxID=6347 RepID=A0A8J1T6F4_OWEFU|nr:unnamed protein product [Owenia fusiformis]
MKLYMLFVICVVLCLITESLDAKRRPNKKSRTNKHEKMKKKNKMPNVQQNIYDDLPALRLMNMVDNLPSKDVIPVLNMTSTLSVNVGIALLNLLELDYSHMKVIIWLRLTWKNEFLQWDPEDYAGINSIRVPIEKMWKPDIVLYNSLKKSEMLFEALAVVNNDGTVLWVPSMEIISSCKKTEKTPNKCSINCPLKFGSWTRDGYQLDLTSEKEIDLNDYQENEEWQVQVHTQTKHTKFYPCCKEPYPDVTGNLTFVARSDSSDEC